MDPQVLNYIISLVPPITAILTAIATMIGIFIKIKQLSQTNNDEMRKNSAKVNAVLQENAELKKEMSRVLRKIHKVSNNGKEE